MAEEEQKKTEGPKEEPTAETKADAQPEEPAAKEPAAEDAPAAEAPQPAEPDWKDRYARLLADFDNFKKRTARDREDTYRYAEADILKDILPTVDNLALALSKAEDKENAFVKGVQLVHDNLLKALKDHDAEPFDSIGKELDTERMNAISTMPSDAVEEGKVLFESKRGWTLRGKVLRVADVVVSAGKKAE
ncbi:MAG: nucleotide exchange factor GrpE [Kiritimatiellae bacterium]|nr:nucleotide exchange factor GrpE [Kiritimatiellia bacterium]